jgi:aspartyl-tRNA(Asn)/glutamyl-tRNA(Gln) amidotransferase subunit C
MITKREVKHIAKLARLGLAPKETGKLQKELSTILDYVEKLKEVDILGVAPTSHPFEIENVMREDIIKSKIKNQKSKILLKLAPEIKNGYLKVKSIL